jgi:hypothetical protein
LRTLAGDVVGGRCRCSRHGTQAGGGGLGRRRFEGSALTSRRHGIAAHARVWVVDARANALVEGVAVGPLQSRVVLLVEVLGAEVVGLLLLDLVHLRCERQGGWLMPSSEKREPAGVRAHLLEELVRSRRSGCVARSGLLLRLGPVGPFRSRCTTTLRARSRRVRLEVREPMLERERMGDLPCWSSVVLFRAWLGTAAVMILPRHSLRPVRLRPQVITNGRSEVRTKGRFCAHADRDEEGEALGLAARLPRRRVSVLAVPRQPASHRQPPRHRSSSCSWQVRRTTRPYARARVEQACPLKGRPYSSSRAK